MVIFSQWFLDTCQMNFEGKSRISDFSAWVVLFSGLGNRGVCAVTDDVTPHGNNSVMDRPDRSGPT